MITYKTMHWDFNRKLFAQVMREWVEHFGTKAVAEMLGVSTGAISGWSHMDTRTDYPWPGMMSFMRVVNELDLDPYDFFVLKDI